MYFRCAGISETDLNTAGDQRPHQTFRAVHDYSLIAQLIRKNWNWQNDCGLAVLNSKANSNTAWAAIHGQAALLFRLVMFYQSIFGERVRADEKSENFWLFRSPDELCVPVECAALAI